MNICFIFTEIEAFIKSPLTTSNIVNVGVCVLGFENNFKIQCEIRAFDPDSAPQFIRGQHVIVQGEIVRKSTYN